MKLIYLKAYCYSEDELPWLKWPRIVGAHMFWDMPIETMVRKLKSYSHPEYEVFADKNVLADAVNRKEYIFDKNRKFTIEEFDWDDSRIPSSLKISGIE